MITVINPGAGNTRSVVNYKSRLVPEDYSMLAGNPAQVLKRLDPAECHQSTHEYCGFFRKTDFVAFRTTKLTH